MSFAERRKQVISGMRAGFVDGPARYTPALFLPSSRHIRLKRSYGCWRLAKDYSQIRLLTLKRKHGVA
jgi:hypothetical protein